jgi:hypothetical protein
MTSGYPSPYGPSQDVTQGATYDEAAAAEAAAAAQAQASIGGPGQVIYVSASAQPGGDGSSWEKALSAIPENVATGTEVWVANGTYTAAQSQADTAGASERSNSIRLSEGVSYYGGFTGNETDKSQRDVTNNKATLTGERGAAGNADNSYTVVTGAKDAVLDGFVVTGGNATPDPSDTQTAPQANTSAPPSGDAPLQGNASAPPGGMAPPQGSAPPSQGSSPPAQGSTPASQSNTSPSPSNTAAPPAEGGGPPVHLTPEMILSDAADGKVMGAGGGISITDGMQVRNTDVTGNKAIKGGGVYINTATRENFSAGSGQNGQAAEVVMNNVNIYANEGTSRGGGIEAELGSSVTVANSSVQGNVSDKGGGMYLDFMASAKVLNSTVTGNSAQSAAGIGSDGSGSVAIGKSTIAGNAAADEGGGLYLGTGGQNRAVVVDSVVSGNTARAGGADTYVWHGNDIQLSNSTVSEGDVTSEGRATSAGADRSKPLSSEEASKLGGEFDRLMPNTTSSSTTPSAAPASGESSSNSTTTTPPSNRVVYVNANAAEGGDGSSWDSAYASLTDALKDADTDNAQVWLTSGTYKPEGDSREATFKIQDGVKLYGGFTGNEISTEQRRSTAERTVLDGDIGKAGDNADNAYHVVTGGNDIAMDNMLVRNGNADGSGYNGHGGGMVNYENTTQVQPDKEQGFTNIALKNVDFETNNAKAGGAMYNYGNSDIQISDSLFSNNTAQSGGAVMDRVGVHTQLDNVSFEGNKASGNGGAYYLDYGSRLQATNTVAKGNEAGNDGGVLYSASRASQLEESVASINGGSFSNNKAGRSGSLMAVDDMSKAYVTNTSLTATDPLIAVSKDSTFKTEAAPEDLFTRKVQGEISPTQGGATPPSTATAGQPPSGTQPGTTPSSVPAQPGGELPSSPPQGMQPQGTPPLPTGTQTPSQDMQPPPNGLQPPPGGMLSPNGMLPPSGVWPPPAA